MLSPNFNSKPHRKILIKAHKHVLSALCGNALFARPKTASQVQQVISQQGIIQQEHQQQQQTVGSSVLSLPGTRMHTHTEKSQDDSHYQVIAQQGAQDLNLLSETDEKEEEIPLDRVGRSRQELKGGLSKKRPSNYHHWPSPVVSSEKLPTAFNNFVGQSPRFLNGKRNEKNNIMRTTESEQNAEEDADKVATMAQLTNQVRASLQNLGGGGRAGGGVQSTLLTHRKNDEDSEAQQRGRQAPSTEKVPEEKLQNPLLPFKKFLQRQRQSEKILKQQEQQTENALAQVLQRMRVAAAQEQELDAGEDQAGGDSLQSQQQQQTPLSQASAFQARPLLSEAITLQHFSSTCRKILHAPTLRLYVVKEWPLRGVEREQLERLKAFLAAQQEKLRACARTVAVQQVFFNQPENHVSVVTEYFGTRGTSLDSLLSACITLNESALRSLAFEILLALKEVHAHTGKSYAALAPSQVLIDAQGAIKLGLGLQAKFAALVQQQKDNAANNNNQSHYQNSKGFRACATAVKQHFVKRQRIRSPIVARNDFNNSCVTPHAKKDDSHFSEDVFELGLLMLCAAVGVDLSALLSTDILQQSLQQRHAPSNHIQAGNDKAMSLAQQTKAVQGQIRSREELQQLVTNAANAHTHACCFLHLIMQYGRDSVTQQKNKESSSNSSRKLPLNAQECVFFGNLLSRSFSTRFLNFLCRCLRLKDSDRPQLSRLLEDEFLLTQSSTTQNVQITLTDLLNIARLEQRRKIQPLATLTHLCKQLPVVLPTCERFFKHKTGLILLKKLITLTAENSEIKQLAADFELPENDIAQEITRTLREGTKLFSLFVGTKSNAINNTPSLHLVKEPYYQMNANAPVQKMLYLNSRPNFFLKA